MAGVSDCILEKETGFVNNLESSSLFCLCSMALPACRDDAHFGHLGFLKESRRLSSLYSGDLLI